MHFSLRQSIRILFLNLVAVSLFVAGSLKAAPNIANYVPYFGTPGTQVELTGTGLTNAWRVEFGDQREANFQVISDSRIVAVVPDDAVIAPIKVTTLNGVGNTAFPFYPSPRIETFTPLSGSTNTTVTINGANFIQDYTTVRFGSVTSFLATVTADTQIQAPVPAGVSNALIFVITGAGTATSRVEFVSTTAPSIESFSPTSGLGGAGVPVVLNGANFKSVTNVAFNGTNAPFVVTADTQIQTTIPAGARTGKIRVGTTNGAAFSLTDFVVGPTITAFEPPAGQVGEFINIRGNDFTGVTNVTFNGVAAVQFQLLAQNQLNVRIPTGATTGTVRLRTPNGEAISAFPFFVGPLITGFDPEYGPVGANVVINGAGFSTTSKVYFGTNQSQNVVLTAATQLHATVPAGATNGPISVVTSGITNTTLKKFLVTTSVPLVDRFEPAVGPRGTEVKVEGAKFIGATSVLFGGVPAAFQVTADTQLITIVPPGARSGKISVVNPSGSASSAGLFYVGPWTTSFNPTQGQSGTFLTLLGTNYTGLNAVYVGGEPVQIFSVSDTNVVVLTTPNARSGPIQVNTPGGTFITTNRFTVLPRITGFQPQIGPVGFPVVITGTSFFNVTNVSFNGIAATYQVVTPERIETTVPAGATTGFIRVGTQDGEAFSAIPFTVTQPGNLIVTDRPSTNVALPGQLITYTTIVSNAGPTIQTGIRLTNTFSGAPDLSSVSTTHGGCVIDGQFVKCDLNIITNGRAATITVDATYPVSGAFTNTAFAVSIEGDTSIENNTARSVVVVATEAQRTLGIELLSAKDKVVVTWPASPVPFRLQSLQQLLNVSNQWSNVVGAPVTVNGTNRFTNSVGRPQEFFRLNY